MSNKSQDRDGVGGNMFPILNTQKKCFYGTIL